MRVPTRLLIGGKAIKIEYTDELYDDDGVTPIYGETVINELHIKIGTVKPQNEIMVWQTLFHELCHIVFDITGVDHQLEPHKGLEETICTSLDNLLGPWLRLRADIPGAKYAEVEFEFEAE